MLTLPGQAWTTGRLLVAADTLARSSGQALERKQVERLLRRALGLNLVMLKEPALSAVDSRQWGVRQIAQALL